MQVCKGGLALCSQDGKKGSNSDSTALWRTVGLRNAGTMRGSYCLNHSQVYLLLQI